jgi:hypothetical protein
MKISTNNIGPARAAQQAERAREAQPQPVEREAVRESGDRIDLSRESESSSTTQRVDDFAEKTLERLAQLAEDSGTDTTDAARAFDKNMERLKAGLADGSLTGRDMAQGISNALDILKADLDDSSDPVRPDATRGSDQRSDSERVESLAAGIEDRITSLAAELGDREGLGSALEAFGGNVDRLLAGIQDGSLSGDQLAQGIQNVLDMVSSDVQRAVAPPTDGRVDLSGPDRPPVDSNPAGSTERRFGAFVQSAESRLAEIASDLSPEQREGFAKLQADFSSSMDRLGSAFFDKGSIDRDQFKELFNSLFEGLKSDVQGLFGGSPGGNEAASLYNPVTGVEQLGSILPGSLDATA